jgi:NADPH:quinone reductase-like Zn-dependent oxidoreductase
MKAVIASAQFGHAQVITNRPRPQLRPTYILVRTVAVAVNPADNLYLQFGLAQAGSLLGNDYAGIIEQVGLDAERSWKVGDRVCGCTRGGDANELENGTAAEYVVVKAGLQVRIPDGMSFEDAASTGVTFLTTGRCLVGVMCTLLGVVENSVDVDDIRSIKHSASHSPMVVPQA